MVSLHAAFERNVSMYYTLSRFYIKMYLLIHVANYVILFMAGQNEKFQNTSTNL